MMRIATLCSHGGSILQAVIDAIEGGTLDAQIVLVISNNSRAEAIRRATRHGIPTLHLSSHTHPDEAARDAALTSALAESAADWVLLAGYMKKLGPQTLARFPQRILNTHPALLPKHGGRGFYGRRVPRPCWPPAKQNRAPPCTSSMTTMTPAPSSIRPEFR
tara:strand:+ start:4191 stop:4676 length:486 start_codon:yes stop_codon:yes gene_type:complete